MIKETPPFVANRWVHAMILQFFQLLIILSTTQLNCWHDRNFGICSFIWTGMRLLLIVFLFYLSIYQKYMRIYVFPQLWIRIRKKEIFATILRIIQLNIGTHTYFLIIISVLTSAFKKCNFLIADSKLLLILLRIKNKI